MSVHIWQADKLCTSGLLLARNTTKCLTPSLAICHYQYVHLFKDVKDSKSYFLFFIKVPALQETAKQVTKHIA